MEDLNEKIINSMGRVEKKQISTTDLIQQLLTNIKDAQEERKIMFSLLQKFIESGITKEEKKEIKKQL